MKTEDWLVLAGVACLIVAVVAGFALWLFGLAEGARDGQ